MVTGSAGSRVVKYNHSGENFSTTSAPMISVSSPSSSAPDSAYPYNIPSDCVIPN